MPEPVYDLLTGQIVAHAVTLREHIERDLVARIEERIREHRAWRAKEGASRAVSTI